jgi:hypothetical protein
MISSPLSPTDKIAIGNAAAWHLSFLAEAGKEGPARFPGKPVLELGSDMYHAEIQASLSSNLEGGLFSFVIEGLTDAHYKQIRRDPQPQDRTSYPEYVQLYLYWLDANSSATSYLKNLAGLTDSGGLKGADLDKNAYVATLKINTVTRRAGQRGYEATITARDWLYDRVTSRRHCGKPLRGTDPAPVLKTLLETSGQLIENQHFLFRGADPNGTSPPKAATGTPPGLELGTGAKVIEHLETIGRFLEAKTGCYGRGMFLIRDGQLHVGTRPIPMPDQTTEPKKLSLATGLVESEPLETIETDPNFEYCMATGAGEPPRRRQFRLTLKGRADLKPGDLVLFNPSPEDVSTTGGGVLGAIGDMAKAMASSLVPALGETFDDKSVRLYVSSVQHRLGRVSSFVTTVNGVEIADLTQKWDSHTPGDHHEDAAEPTHADPDIDTAKAVKDHARKALAGLALPEVGEIRGVSSTGGPDKDPPAQTNLVWRGIEPEPAVPYPARSGKILRPSRAPSKAVPYTSPFAWGKCGLVLPRYPGTRVLVVPRGGRDDDPVDVGAIWESGHGPESRPGDWWLILPIGVDDQKRTSLDDQEAPEEHTGPVSQDLIDGDGNRVINVGELTIHVGRSDLKGAGDRPARGTEDAITITHSDGAASIVIDKDGKVTITAKEVAIATTSKGITLDAGSSDITMKANNVNVSVKGVMNVQG